MASAGTMCDEADVALKATKMSDDIDDGDTEETDVWIVDAEALVCCVGRYDFITNWASLDANSKRMLTDIVGSLAAIMAVNYDMSVFTSRTEAENIINILRDNALRGLSVLRDFKAREHLING